VGETHTPGERERERGCLDGMGERERDKEEENGLNQKSQKILKLFSILILISIPN
jgi:hypothetical protein